MDSGQDRRLEILLYACPFFFRRGGIENEQRTVCLRGVGICLKPQ